MTGKEIINHADNESEGDWAPSPGLIYPLLGRLVRDGFIMELDYGRYTTTEKGNDVLKQYSKMQDQLDRQFELINKLGISVYTRSKFIAVEALDRINAITSSMRSRVSKRSHDVQENFDVMYEDFLRRELDRLNQKKNAKTSHPDV
jgi:DNA-binding PadR family transcriptional regulator